MKARIPSSAINPVLEQLETRRHFAITHQYTFNDGTANDLVGTAHGTLMNGATVTNGWVWLQNSGKLSNDAALQYVNLPANVLPASGSASVSVWYTNSSVASQWMRVFDFGDQVSGSGNSYFFYSPRTSNSNDARTVLRAAGGTERVANKSGGTYDGFSHTATAVIDSSAGLIRLYVDGALFSSTALSGASAASINNLQSFIGRSLFDADPGFNGAIDELRIYNHALTATEVSQSYGTGATRPVQTTPARQIEKLNRGLVAIRTGTTSAHISWRQLASDPIDVGFNLYRSANGGAFTKVNSTVITNVSDYTQTIDGTISNAYYVKPVINGVEQAASETYTLVANTPVRYFLNIPLNIPAGGTTPDGVAYTYTANDASVGDVDGDGEYEIILKWDPTNAKDNSQSGYTGNVYLDCYKLNGTQLWRIDLGRNIRAGAHYTQFQVFDYDGDGKAEVACKTAPGTIDGLGNPVLMGSDNVNVDYRNTSGYILTGSEYLTMFRGLTGANLSTVAYVVPRGTVSNWGDSYGNRVDRFLAGTAYLDGQRPSLIMCRGYYTRTVLAAWDFRNGSLTQRWVFDTGNSTTGSLAGYRGQGDHSLTIGDVDGDGKDEITYGAMAINDNGQPLYTTGLGHGDALHMSDMDPINPGLEVYNVHETESAHQGKGGDFRDALTGEILSYVPGTGDVGRGVAFDTDPRYLGFEMWNSSDGGMYNVNGTRLYDKPNVFQNFGTWWDADPLREQQDGTTIGDMVISGTSLARSNFDLDPATSGTQGYAPGGSSNNGTKSTPALNADILGDWREEMIVRTSDNTSLMIFTTPIAAVNRMTTLMHDIQYREAVAWQNTAYNQPTHTSFYLADSMPSAPRPLFYYAGVMETPTNLVATPISSSQINLTWQDTNPAETGFEIQRSTDGTNFTTIATLAPDIFAYGNVTGLSPNTLYYYRVRAIGAGVTTQYSNFSNIDDATTLSNFTPGTISGMVYEDRDGSQTYNGADVAMLGVTVYLDSNNNSTLDSGESTSVTNSLGYSFTGLSPATYVVRQVQPAGTQRTQPSSDSYSFVVNGSSHTGNFGNLTNSFTGTSGSDSWYLRYQPINGKLQIWINATPVSQPLANYTILASLISSLSFNGMAGNDSLTLDGSLGDVIPSGGLSFVGGDDLDTLDLRGTGSNDNFSLATAGLVQHGADSLSYSLDTLKLSAGIFNTSADLGGINLETSGSSATVHLTQTQTLNSLAVLSGATVNSSSTNLLQPAMTVGSVTINGGKLSITPNGGVSGVSKFGSLAIDATGRLDLHDNDLILDYTGGASPYASIRNELKRGLSILGGAGVAGIGSAEIDSPSNNGKMLALVDNGDPLAGGAITSLSGYTGVPVTSVLIKYTWMGDANFSGDIDGNDYGLVDSGFTTGGISQWLVGDFNFDDSTTGEDYALVDTGFISQNQIL